jgi:hypothetical protein
MPPLDAPKTRKNTGNIKYPQAVTLIEMMIAYYALTLIIYE